MPWKRTFPALLAFVFFVLFSLGVVFASEDETNDSSVDSFTNTTVSNSSPTSVSDKLKQMRQIRQEKIENLREKKKEIRENIATKQAEIKERVVGRIKEIFSMMLKRHNAALERLDKIAERIASRIDKLKARG